MSNIIKIGNSYGTVISKNLDSLNIKLGDEIDLEIKNEDIFIKKHEKRVFSRKFCKSFQDNGIINDESGWGRLAGIC